MLRTGGTRNDLSPRDLTPDAVTPMSSSSRVPETTAFFVSISVYKVLLIMSTVSAAIFLTIMITSLLNTDPHVSTDEEKTSPGYKVPSSEETSHRIEHIVIWILNGLQGVSLLVSWISIAVMQLRCFMIDYFMKCTFLIIEVACLIFYPNAEKVINTIILVMYISLLAGIIGSMKHQEKTMVVVPETIMWVINRWWERNREIS